MKKMTAEKLQRELQASMLDGEYTIAELYTIYTLMMGMDFNLQFKAMEEKTFRNKLTEWSNADGSWLIKKGKGKSALYHKWVCHRFPLMTRKQLGLKAKKILERLTSW